MITALPDVRTLMIDPAEDEFMVLACDGIWNFMSSQEVVDFVRTRIQEGQTKLSKICEEVQYFIMCSGDMLVQEIATQLKVTLLEFVHCYAFLYKSYISEVVNRSVFRGKGCEEIPAVLNP
jgi:hypothetical protein